MAGKKKYKVTFYYHTNVTVEVEAENEKYALAMAEDRVGNTEYVPQILDGLQEDSSPDVEEIGEVPQVKLDPNSFPYREYVYKGKRIVEFSHNDFVGFFINTLGDIDRVKGNTLQEVCNKLDELNN